MERKLSKICTPCNWLLITLTLIYFCSFTVCTANEISSSPLMPVKIIDGDSLEIGTSRIRLMGIDAPEYTQYCKNAKKKNYPCGKISADYLENLIKNKPITCKIHKKDQYERDLCTCYKNNLDLNAEMIRAGQAIVYLESPYQDEQAEAKRNKRGLWQGRFMHPRLFRRLKEQQKLN